MAPASISRLRLACRSAVAAFLPDDDPLAPRALTVLGNKVKQELFGNSNPIGQRIRIGGDRYRIVGVMEAKGQVLGFDLDDTVYIPLARGLEMFNRDGLVEIDVQYHEGYNEEKVVEGIKRLLMARHGREDFTITTQQQMLDVLGDHPRCHHLRGWRHRRYIAIGGWYRYHYYHDYLRGRAYLRDWPDQGFRRKACTNSNVISWRSGGAGGHRWPGGTDIRHRYQPVITPDHSRVTGTYALELCDHGRIDGYLDRAGCGSHSGATGCTAGPRRGAA